MSCQGILMALATSAIATIQGTQIEPIVAFRGEMMRFSNNERPYFLGRTAMLPLNAICSKLRATVRRSRDGRQWTIARGTDRLDFSAGYTWFVFNGARREMFSAPEERGRVLFVPFELIEPMSGGGLEVKSDFGAGRGISVYFGDRLLRYTADESPFHRAGTVFVSVRPTAASIGARVDRITDGGHITITRSRDKVWYDLGQRFFTFNGAQRSLRSEAVVRGQLIFVPIELFQALVGEEIRSR